MKLTKKLFAVALAGVMGLSMFATPAFAAAGSEEGDTDGTGSIATSYKYLSQRALSTNVDYEWEDLTWTYCVPVGGEGAGWVVGSKAEQESLSHTAYNNLGITVPTQNADNLAQDISVTNNSADPVTLTITLASNDTAANLVIYAKSNNTYADSATTVSGVTIGTNEEKIYGVYPTATNLTEGIEGTLTLTFGH